MTVIQTLRHSAVLIPIILTLMKGYTSRDCGRQMRRRRRSSSRSRERVRCVRCLQWSMQQRRKDARRSSRKRRRPRMQKAKVQIILKQMWYLINWHQVLVPRTSSMSSLVEQVNLAFLFLILKSRTPRITKGQDRCYLVPCPCRKIPNSWPKSKERITSTILSAISKICKEWSDSWTKTKRNPRIALEYLKIINRVLKHLKRAEQDMALLATSTKPINMTKK